MLPPIQTKDTFSARSNSTRSNCSFPKSEPQHFPKLKGRQFQKRIPKEKDKKIAKKITDEKSSSSFLDISSKSNIRLVRYSDDSSYYGELLNGLRHGSGMCIFANGNSYNGEWKNNQFEGTGIFKWKNGCKFEGQYQQGKRHGKGRFSYPCGISYEGEFDQGLAHGKGILITPNFRYEGFWEHGKMQAGSPLAFNKKTGKVVIIDRLEK